MGHTSEGRYPSSAILDSGLHQNDMPQNPVKNFLFPHSIEQKLHGKTC
ncbi:MAG: hypothetical protein OEV44_06775 [Spirochaetota bacterium]|nr:hypothetical protein [Spirochaetota bacterium]